MINQNIVFQQRIGCWVISQRRYVLNRVQLQLQFNFGYCTQLKCIIYSLDTIGDFPSDFHLFHLASRFWTSWIGSVLFYSMQFNLIQFNSIQFSSVQLNLIQLVLVRVVIVAKQFYKIHKKMKKDFKKCEELCTDYNNQFVIVCHNNQPAQRNGCKKKKTFQLNQQLTHLPLGNVR